LGHRVGLYIAAAAGLLAAAIAAGGSAPVLVVLLGLASVAAWGEVVVAGLEGVAEAAGLEAGAASVVVNTLAVMPEASPWSYPPRPWNS
jgi:disulfide bond formation protein DsbB